MPRHTSGPKIRSTVRHAVEREQEPKERKRWADMTQAERAAIVRDLKRPRQG